jgi:hypothetical protein
VAIINNWLKDVKLGAKLNATTFVIHKIDKEKAADYVLDYAQKQYGKHSKKFVEEFYLGLLEFVSAVNRRRK